MSTQEQEQGQVESKFDNLMKKSQSRLIKMKHIDAKSLALDYIFPLLTAMRQDVGEDMEAIFDQMDDIEEATGFDGGILDVISDNAEIVQMMQKHIVISGAVVDLLMSSGGFSVVENGVAAFTNLMTDDLKTAYGEMSNSQTEIITKLNDIQDQIDSLDDDEDDDESDPVSDSSDDLDDDSDIEEESGKSAEVIILPSPQENSINTPSEDSPIEQEQEQEQVIEKNEDVQEKKDEESMPSPSEAEIVDEKEDDNV